MLTHYRTSGGNTAFVRIAIMVAAVVAGGARAIAVEPRMLARQGVVDMTRIVRDGRSDAVIVYPRADAVYKTLGEKIQGAVKDATGAELPLLADNEARVGRFAIDPALKKQHLILLGNLNSNPALVQLGAMCYVDTTAQWPGENGFVVRSVTNPFGSKRNCIVLGGSDTAGVAAAIEYFIDKVVAAQQGPDLRSPRLCHVVVGGEEQTQTPARAYNPEGPNGTYSLASTIDQYHRTGSTARLEVVRKTLLAYLEADNPPAAADYGTESAIRALDLVDSFALSDEENLKMDRLLFGWVQKIINERPYWNAQGRRWSFGGHQACGAMSFLAAAQYLLNNGTPNEEARQLLETQSEASREFLRYLSTSFKDAQKDVGWETWTPLSVPGRYALLENDLTFFDKGLVTQVVQRNFYADRGFGPAAIAAFVLNDGRYKSLSPAGGSLSGWAYVIDGPNLVTPDELAPAEPDFLIGTKVMPASATDWEHAHRDDASAQWHTLLPYEKTFHVIGFTDGVGPEDTKLVLGGWDSKGNPGEANSIRTFSLGGHRYLFRADGNDNRKPRPGRRYQNSIVVESGRYEAAAPCAAELRGHVDMATGGLTGSRLSGFHGVDWDRNVYWRKGRYFAVIDVCRVANDGPINIVNQWWNMDAPGLDEGRWVAQTDKGMFNLVMADAGEVTNRQGWNGGPFQLRQSKYLHARAGQTVSFLNLFYVDEIDRPQRIEVRQLTAEALIVKGTAMSQTGPVDELSIVGCNSSDSADTFGSISIDAERYLVSPDLVMVSPGLQPGAGAEGSTITIDGQAIEIDAATALPSAEQAERLGDVLMQLWDEAGEPGDEPVEKSDAPPPAELAISNRVGSGLETGYMPITGVWFDTNKSGLITWDLGRPYHVKRIEGLQVDGPAARVRYDTNELTDASPLVIVGSGLEKQWVYYQYGFAASLAIPILSPVGQTARYLRVEPGDGVLAHGRRIHQEWHRQGWNINGHNPELFDRPIWQDVLFRSDEPLLNYTRSVTADLYGDASEELVVATDRNELAVFNADGGLSWKHKLDAPITGLICEDLDGIGAPQVLCTTKDTALHQFSGDGKSHKRIDFLPYSGLNSLSLYGGDGPQRGLFVGTYHHLLKLDAFGRLMMQVSGSGFYHDTMPAVAWDVTGDGVDDVLLRENVWGLVSLVDGVQFKALASHSTRHLGRGLAMLPWRSADSERGRRFLVIAESGIAMLEVTGEPAEAKGGSADTVAGGIQQVFGLSIAPVVGWAVTDVDDNGSDEIIVANAYGGILVLDEGGRTIASTVAASQVYDLAVMARPGGIGGVAVLAATNRGILALDGDLNLIAASVKDVADCRKIETVRAGDEKVAICLFANGQSAVITGGDLDAD